ncbi:hypothetical protein K4K61_008197 [Colletotrichum sp. SAR11_59]|nr:hypothetical protein K4K61_008197 [Colletotrichum sp. SAR11_59]
MADMQRRDNNQRSHARRHKASKAMHEPRYQSEKLKYLRAGNLIEKLCFNCFALCSEGAQKRKAMSLGRISQHRSVYFGELA